jgi:ribonuclease P protein subunit RPR2
MAKKKISKQEAIKEIENFFNNAEHIAMNDEETARRYVRKARRIAMHFNLKLPREIRKKFCRGCYSFFTSSNCKRRIKHGYLILECLNCKRINRYKF